MIEYFLNPQSIEALGWTLLHSVWQGAIFAILLVLILIALRSYSAQSRYVVSVGLLCAFFLTLSGTFWMQWQEANSRFDLMTEQLNTPLPDGAFVMNDSSGQKMTTGIQGQSTLNLSSEALPPEQSSWLISFRDYYDQHLPLLVTIWFLGVLFLQLRFLGQLAYVQRLKHYGAQLFPASWKDKIEELENKLRIQKNVDYLTSIRIETPMVIGWLKPVVLVPQQLFTSLSETEIYAVLAHELAHIRREDFIVNLMQTFLCNIFFFHPGVWWMSNRIDDEREHCCDDLAVAATGPATSYAKTLINVSELQLRMQRNTPLAMALSGKAKKRDRGGFSDRIKRLFLVSNGAGSFREGFATAFILITALFLGVAATGSTVQATESSNQIETETLGFGSEIDPPTANEIKPNSQTTTVTIKTEISPSLGTNSALDIKDLPIADPVEPANQVLDFSKLPTAEPASPEQPVRPSETRVDALVMACEEGDLDFVKTLVSTGIDVNGIGSDGFTPLMMATSNEESEIVYYLLQNGAKVNQTYNGWSALIEAADEGSLQCMKYLLEAGAEVNYYWTHESPTAISMAASEGNLECLKLLLINGADMNGIGKSIPPLHIAAEENKRDIIKYLISQKVIINEKDASGRTALMYAASEGHKYAVIQLIEAGADISMLDSNGYNAKDYALDEEQYDIVEMLKGEDEDSFHYDAPDYSETKDLPELHQLTKDGFIEIVQLKIEQGADVNSLDQYGRTLLHIASGEGHNIDMRVLFDLGADLNAQDKQGRTPLMYAAAEGKRDAVVLLVSQVANVNIKDADGRTAYDWSRSGGNKDLSRFLGLITENKAHQDQQEIQSSRPYSDLQKEQEKEVQKQKEKHIQKELAKRESFHVTDNGVHLRQFDLEENTPRLMEAARSGTIQDCATLLNNGLKVNTSDATGQTALMVAVRSNRIDIARFLIDQGADINRSSASGLTALHYAALDNYTEMAQLLLDKEVYIDPTMHYSSTDGNYSKKPYVWEYIGATPLLIAVESGNTEITAILIKAGANTNHTLIRNEYLLNKNRATYLTGGEVMGLDQDFLQEVEFQTSDEKWTPYKQALLLNKPEILAFFPK